MVAVAGSVHSPRSPVADAPRQRTPVAVWVAVVLSFLGAAVALPLAALLFFLSFGTGNIGRGLVTFLFALFNAALGLALGWIAIHLRKGRASARSGLIALSVIGMIVSLVQLGRGDAGPDPALRRARRRVAIGNAARRTCRGRALIYLDASALITLITGRSYAAPLRDFLSAKPSMPMGTSSVGLVETVRTLDRIGDFPTAMQDLVRDFTEILLTDEIRDAAAFLTGGVRTLDAIHIASAQAVGEVLDVLVSYDKRVLDIAASVGLPTAAPGLK
jgi:uncharacterized protein